MAMICSVINHRSPNLTYFEGIEVQGATCVTDSLLYPAFETYVMSLPAGFVGK